MQSNTLVLDTSFISALLNQNDALHEQAKTLAHTLNETKRIILPATVLLEIFTTQKASDISLKKVEGFLLDIDAEIIYIDKEFISYYKQEIEKTKLKLKTIDYTILVTVKRFRAKLLTFDKTLEKAYEPNKH